MIYKSDRLQIEVLKGRFIIRFNFRKWAVRIDGIKGEQI